jgi:DNA modification methylase
MLKQQKPKMEIVYKPVSELKPYENNPRRHSKKQIGQIAQSIVHFGFVNPIIISDDGTIAAGHGRYLAALMLGFKEVPTVLLGNMSPYDLNLYRITDNRLAELSGWDDEILAIELEVLSEISSPQLDMTISGFTETEIDKLLRRTSKDVDDEVPEDIQSLAREKAVSKAGDIWILGSHKILCGDSMKPESYELLMEAEKARACVTDPPYNVSISNHVTTKRGKYKEFANASGDDTPEQFTNFLMSFMHHATAHSVDGSLHYIFSDWRHTRETSAACYAVYKELKNICIWNKDNGGMGSLYRSKHEMVYVCKHGTEPHVNNIELGKNGRYRTNVWDCPGQNTFHKDRDKELAMHPTVKPLQLIADIILDCTKNKDIVLDPFGGAGTTLLAAEKTGRRARLIEIDPIYVDVTIRRWQQKYGLEAVHGASGKAFNAMETAANLEQPGGEP